jgi:hypothetical protein
LYIDKDMTLQKQLQYIYREFLVDTQWVEDQLNDPKARTAEVDYDSGPRKEIKKERTNKTSTIFFAIVTVTALFSVSFILASEHASAAIVHHKVAVHHKAHTVHQVAVIPEAHNNPDKVLQNATAMKALVKGPNGENIVIGGMMSDGY